MVTSLLSKVFKRKAVPVEEVDRLLQSVIERRVAPRFEVREMTNLYVTQRPLSAVVVDISLTGARFATRLPRDVGSVVGLELTFEDETFILPLRILWDKWSGGCYEHGGVFVDLTPIEEDHLRRFTDWAGENPPDTSASVSEMLIARALEGLPQLMPS